MKSDTTARELSPTEQRHPATFALDSMTSQEIVELMNHEDQHAIDAVAAAAPALATLIDEALARMRDGGVIHYFGAGTSGRLGVLDAAELLPTFNVPAGLVTAHIAGGPSALINAVENSEDSLTQGQEDAAQLGPHDLALGLAASGGTPYVGAALSTARAKGAYTALLTSNPNAVLAELADLVVVADTGAEVLTGSTRLKAGTALKTMLNAFSTALMVRSGRVWSNLMVSMLATNAKLRDRAVRMLMDAAELDAEQSAAALNRAGGDLKVAIVASLSGADATAARAALDSSASDVRAALDRLSATRRSATPHEVKEEQ